jgi:tetratricopeptide (TPR) repeat protein
MLEVELRQQLERSNAPERLRALLEAVAILGTAVDVALLQAFLAEDETRHQLDDDLDRCLDLGLLQWSQQGKAEVVAFSPAVMRDVVLAGLNPRRARRLHGRAIDVRQVWAGAEVDAEAGALGDHCEAVGRMHEAVDWWLRGQRYEREGGDALLGLEWGRKALAALAPDDPRYAPCAIALGRTLLDAGELDQAAEVLLPVVSGVDADLAMQAGDVLADVYENRGSQEAWTRLIDTMSGREHEASDVGRTYLYIARAMWSSYYGTRSDALRDAERAVELAAPGEQAQRAAQRLAFQHVFEGDAVTAERHARRALEESGNRSDLRTRSLRLIGMVCEAMGRPEEALALHREALEICRRSGLTARIPIALVDIGDLMTLLDQSEDARARFREAEHAAQELGLRGAVAAVELRYLLLDLEQGRTERIFELIDETFRRADEVGVSPGDEMRRLCEAWAHAIHGRVRACLDVLQPLGPVEQFPMHARYARMLVLLLEQLVRTAESQPLSPADRADVERLLDGITTLLRRLPRGMLTGRADGLRERLAATA